MTLFVLFFHSKLPKTLIDAVLVFDAAAMVVDFSFGRPYSFSLTNWLRLRLGFWWNGSLNTHLLSIRAIRLGLHVLISTVGSHLFGKQIKVVRLKAHGPSIALDEETDLDRSCARE